MILFLLNSGTFFTLKYQVNVQKLIKYTHITMVKGGYVINFNIYLSILNYGLLLFLAIFGKDKH